MNVHYASYEGWKMKGKAEKIMPRGRVVMENGEYGENKAMENFSSVGHVLMFRKQ